MDEAKSNGLIATLLYLREDSPHKEITLYFNVPGALVRHAVPLIVRWPAWLFSSSGDLSRTLACDCSSPAAPINANP